MLRFDAQDAECLVFTEKDGLLSPVAHDLKIRVSAWSAELDEDTRRVVARFDATSLRVLCAMRGGIDDTRALGDKDRRDIENNIRDTVLRASRYAEISFEAPRTPTMDELATEPRDVHGHLTMCGETREIRVRVTLAGQRVIAEARVHQSDFGIKPYSAFFGTLKVKPDVRVVVTLPD